MIDEMHIPQAEKLEQTVLGALLMESGYLPEVVTELTPDSFYDPFNAKVYGVIRTMYDSGEQIDLFTVSQRCKRDKELAGENVVAKLSGYTMLVGSGAGVDSDGSFIREPVAVSSNPCPAAPPGLRSVMLTVTCPGPDKNAGFAEMLAASVPFFAGRTVISAELP